MNGIVSDLFGHPTAPPDAAVVFHPPPPPAPPDAAQGDVVDPYANLPDAAPLPDAPDFPDATAADEQHTSDLADQVERKSADSQSRFTHCYEDSAKAYTPDQPLAGEVDIAFRVMPTGEVQNAASVKNTTGSDKLADCLTAVISAWTFSPSDLTEPAVFVRPFRFDGH